MKIKRNPYLIIATLSGMVFGYGYFTFKGCEEGCMITGNLWISILYFGVVFFLGSDFIYQLIKKQK